MAELTRKEELERRNPEKSKEIDEYIGELMDYARDDYDFVVKFLKKQFESALGNNDGERAKFFAKVANGVEKSIGRIPYDYDLKTKREKEDINNYLKQKSMEDARQREEEQEFEQQQEYAEQEVDTQIREDANARGLLDSGIQKKTQQKAKYERKIMEVDPTKRAFAYRQALRNEDARIAKQESGRNLADIKTSARRAAEDEQFNYEYGEQRASKTLEERLRDLELQRKQEYSTAIQQENIKRQLA